MAITKETYGGTTSYWKDDVVHRDDGPAIIKKNGEKYWMVNGKPHRIDGPAVLLPRDTLDARQYWLFGIKYSYNEWRRRVKMLWLL